MKRRLTGWGWAAVGAVSVLLIAWVATTIWTAFKERSIENRVTRIERIVIHREQRQRREVVVGSGHSSPHGLGGPVQGPTANPPTPAPPASEQPGSLDPALHAVCSIADRLAHLCSN